MTLSANENKNNTHFVVHVSSARMPSNCWGKYRHVAVLEISTHVESVSMISERAKGCKKIVAYWGNLNVGTTERCAYRKALKKAHKLCDKLNRNKIKYLARKMKKERNTVISNLSVDFDNKVQNWKEPALKGDPMSRRFLIQTVTTYFA